MHNNPNVKFMRNTNRHHVTTPPLPWLANTVAEAAVVLARWQERGKTTKRKRHEDSSPPPGKNGGGPCEKAATSEVNYSSTELVASIKKKLNRIRLAQVALDREELQEWIQRELASIIEEMHRSLSLVAVAGRPDKPGNR